ncbi:MAG TPA: lysozyme inhibitor LprI family protein [Verrucomicrobiales bacterium]|jgi:uncharacterized protein YecT (DUF1311 family)|nr:lysozyme inhibitor LprI family protein [Verrucomicrobiales bacterium]
MKTLLSALAVCLMFTLTVRAEDEEETKEKKHPIDVKVEKKADNAKSTAATTEAYREGLLLWDKEMNRAYQELKKVLPEKSFAALKAAQLQWISYRDAQIAFINSCYDQYDGTMYIPMRASAIMEVTRARALELLHRLEVHKEHAAEQ